MISDAALSAPDTGVSADGNSYLDSPGVHSYLAVEGVISTWRPL
jgi:hypothetical protein